MAAIVAFPEHRDAAQRGQGLPKGLERRAKGFALCLWQVVEAPDQIAQRIAVQFLLTSLSDFDQARAPVTVMGSPFQQPHRNQGLDRLRCRSARCRVEFRKGRGCAREPIGAGKIPQRGPLSRRQTGIAAPAMHQPNNVQKRFSRAARAVGNVTFCGIESTGEGRVWITHKYGNNARSLR